MMGRILLSGATGFLGSHILEALLDRGYQVSVLKRSSSSLWRIQHLVEKVRFIDVDRTSVLEAFSNGPVDAIIHTACNYGRALETHYQVAETNLFFGLGMLQAAASNGVGLFINADSFFSASDNLSGYLGAYALSKKQFSEWLQLASSPDLKVANLRLQHLYGPRDADNKFIPWLTGELLAGRETVDLTSGTQLRDFVHVRDVADAFVAVLTYQDTLGTWNEFNVGTAHLIPLRSMIEALYSEVSRVQPNPPPRLNFGALPMKPGEIDNPGPIERTSWPKGWRPRIGLKEGLREVVSEFVKNGYSYD